MPVPVGGQFEVQSLPDLSPNVKFDSLEFQMWISLVNRTVRRIFAKHSSQTPSSVNANSTSDQTFTVEGLVADMHAFVNPPDLAAGLSIGYVKVPADNTLMIRFVNTTGGPLTPASGTYHVTAVCH